MNKKTYVPNGHHWLCAVDCFNLNALWKFPNAVLHGHAKILPERILNFY